MDSWLCLLAARLYVEKWGVLQASLSALSVDESRTAYRQGGFDDCHEVLTVGQRRGPQGLAIHNVIFHDLHMMQILLWKATAGPGFYKFSELPSSCQSVYTMMCMQSSGCKACLSRTQWHTVVKSGFRDAEFKATESLKPIAAKSVVKA